MTKPSNDKPLSITEIKTLLLDNQLTEEAITLLRSDERSGVKKLLDRYDAMQSKIVAVRDKIFAMREIEASLRNQGMQLLAGLDEVGRGPLAGPVVSAAVILPTDFPLIPLDDSKKLSKKNRQGYYSLIKNHAIAVGIGQCDAPEIDAINILEATKRSMLKAIASLEIVPDALLIDALKLNTNIPQYSYIKGDATVYSIAAASIVAKEYRDALMADYAILYPEYKFDKNVGYGTKDHLDAFAQYGPTPIHRMTFAPLNKK